mmetsp:Transcript_15966/g.24849  ORF Transcript_15966/g.24849 Transcript_15966/m.24849 type:complete len:550 (+) Transcript_15966:260-1909(+)
MQQAPTPITKRRRRRRCCQSSTTTITLALLLTVAMEMLPPSQKNYYFMAQASSPASLRKKTRRLGGTATTAKTNGSSSSNNNNNNSLERVVIVQPSNLQSSSNGGDNNDANSSVTLHQWPHPDDAPKMEHAMSDEDRAKFLYEVAKYRQTLEGGADTKETKEAVSSEAMQASYNSGGNGGDGGDNEVDTSIATYQEWVAMQMAAKKMGSGSSSRINMNAHGYYLSQQQVGSTAEGVADSSSSVTAAGGEEAPAMQQIIPEKQVILRPMPQLDDPSSSSSPKKTLSVPALLGSTQNGAQAQEPEVYYYDAGGLVGTSYRNAPELTLPDEVYTASGQKLKLSDVHDGGKTEVFLEMNPKTVLGKSLTELNSIQKSMSSSGGSATSSLFVSSAANTAGNAAQQSQDQMIVFLTVATMAIMVGMLSARRLRSRKFLEQCMTPDLEDDLDDVVRYDKKYDGSSGVGSNSSNRYMADAGAASYAYAASGRSTLGGSPERNNSEYAGSETSLPHFSDLYPTQSSSIMGSLSRRSGYGTNDSVGGMNWRGDMEKFDV